jgi:aldehyde dehydrogenase family protein
MTFHSINPTNGEPFATYEEWQPREVQDVIGKVHGAYLAWRRTGFDQRARLMHKAAETLCKHAQSFGRLMAQEMGKPIRDGVAEVQKCALGCAFYADNAARFLAREPVLTEARKSFITFNPIGVVLARQLRRRRTRGALREPVSVNSRTGLRPAEMEIGKWRAETGARNPSLTDQKAKSRRSETGARQPNPRECRGFSHTAK